MALTTLQMILWGWAAMALLQLVLYGVQRARHDAGIVDVGWAFGLALLLAPWYAWNGTGDPTRRILLAVLGGVWGLRLASYLFLDRVLPPGEDGRYQMLRERWGDRAQLWFLLFFQMQGLWSVLFSIPYTEARALVSRGEDYARYQRTTSAFVPWFPRKESP